MKKLSFVLFGYNGVNNTGSEAKLLTTIADLRSILKEKLGKIIVLTQNIKNQRRYIKDASIELLKIGPDSLVNPQILRNDADVLLLSEGSTWIDHFSSMFLLMYAAAAWIAKAKGQKVVAYSNDFGHLKPVNRKIAVKTLNEAVDLIMVRNPDAKRRMEESGVSKDIHIVADGAYLYPQPSERYTEDLLTKLNLNPAKRPVVAVLPKEFFWWPVKFNPFGKRQDRYVWPFHHTWTKKGRISSRNFVAEMANYCDWLVDKLGADVAIIAMEHMDYPPSKAIYEAMIYKEHARLVPSDKYTVDDIVALLSVMRFQITTRYHSTVLASRFGLPMIGVSSDTRLEAVFNETGMQKYFLDYVSHPNPEPKIKRLFDVLVDRTERLLEEEPKVREKLLRANKKFVQRTYKMRKIFRNWLMDTFPEIGELPPVEIPE